MLLYQLLITLVCLAMLVNTFINLRFLRRDRRRARHQPLPSPLPLISVCIPARNEAANIAACVESFARQRYPNFEILVLDDCSEDATGELARSVAARHPALAIRVLAGRPLPPGWIGKPWAGHQLAQAARGPYLLFTDADTVWSPHALQVALRLALFHRTDLLSGLPRLEARGFWEQLSVPMLTLAGSTMVSLPLIAHPAMKDYAAASGAFLFFSRAAYDRLGGHAGVRAEIVEDLAFARRAKRCQARLRMVGAADLVRCRMYTSLPAIWEGFTKNFSKAFPGPLAPLATLINLALFAGPWLSLLAGAALGGGLWAATLLPLMQVTILWSLRALVDHRFGSFSWLGYLLLPVASIFTALIGLRSWSRALLRQPTPWRNRRYELWHHDPDNLRHQEGPQ